jgi:hypothetical protein
MVESTLVRSPSINISLEKIGDFEKHTRGIGSMLLGKMSYDGQGIGKRRQRIIIPIVSMPRDKHEGLLFDGRSEKSITTKTIFVKEKNMPNLSCSLREGETSINEGGNPLPPHTSYGRLKNGSNEETSQTQPTPSLIESNKKINEIKKNKNTKGSTSNMTFVICHCCKKRVHTIDICWYEETCSHCGKKFHLEISC